jgi:glycopeptide antibiotics resistance protein
MDHINKKHNRTLYIISWILFISYSILMLWEVFIGPYRSYSGIRRYNIIPLKTISDFFINRSNYSVETIFINLFANIITFIPLGFFLPWLFKNINSIKKLLIHCVSIILIIEVMQFVLNVGVMDVDDLILNTIGSVIGFIFYRFVIFIKRKDNEILRN